MSRTPHRNVYLAATIVLSSAVLIPVVSPAAAHAAGFHTHETGVDGEALEPATPIFRSDWVGTFTGSPITSPAWTIPTVLNAGWAYSNGGRHRAWDVSTPIGTPLYAPRSGTVIGLNDGVANNPWGKNPGSNSPSNWVLICHTVRGQQVSSYWQHLSPGVPVTVGQQLTGPTMGADGQAIPGTGTHFGYSGNTGNSTGPHLHLATFYGCALPGATGNNSAAAWSRYNYLSKPDTLIYEPNTIWVRPIIDVKKLMTAAKTGGKSTEVRKFRKAVLSTSHSKRANPNFYRLVVTTKKSIGWPKRGKLPNRSFLLALAAQTEDFGIR